MDKNMGKDVALQNERDGFESKWGFILACIGSAVGMGNIWRFPVMVSKYGGMTFLFPFLIFVVLIGATGVIEEMSFGRIAKAGPIGAFGVATERRMVGKNWVSGLVSSPWQDLWRLLLAILVLWAGFSNIRIWLLTVKLLQWNRI